MHMYCSINMSSYKDFEYLEILNLILSNELIKRAVFRKI